MFSKINRGRFLFVAWVAERGYFLGLFQEPNMQAILPCET